MEAVSATNPFNKPPVASPANAPFNRLVLSKNSTSACVASKMPLIESLLIRLTDNPSKDACKLFCFASIELRYASLNFFIAVPDDSFAIFSYFNAVS